MASGKELFRVDNTSLTPLTQGNRSNILGIASYSGTIYIHDSKRIALMENDRIEYRYLSDWGGIEQGATIHDILTRGNQLYVSTDEGLAVLRGMTWYTIQGQDGLPYEETTSLSHGNNRDIWIGSTQGAIRNTQGEYQVFANQRWLPNNSVNDIAVSNDKTYIATDGGLGIVHYEPYTLQKKAAYYERWLDEWGMRRLGFIHHLMYSDGKWLREVSDNDVGYSSHYLAAKCFEYAVTGSKEARAIAVDMMKSVKWSEEITPIDGFPARSIYATQELTIKADHGSGGLPAEWTPTPDGNFEWKGDTSSDEMVAQVYETILFIELVANEDEKVWATEHLNRIVGHVVDNGWVLRDVDGKPTRWARWDPAYLQQAKGYAERGLNALEAFGFVTAAQYLTKNPKFTKGKQELVDFGYPAELVRQKRTFHPGYFTHFDDRLAFYSYYPFLNYETDPHLRALIMRSLERSWEIKRIENVPWFSFIYGALTGNECENERAVKHLREWPLDLHRYTYINSNRDDLNLPDGYHTYANRSKPLSPRATSPNRWDRDFMRLDQHHNGNTVADPGGWIEAYWMGRYYGMIKAPTTTDAELLTVPDRGLKFGAEPYTGPARPKLKHER